MKLWKASAQWALCAILTMAGLQAQGQLGVGPTQLNPGDTATITYDNPELAGETVIVQVSDGGIRDPNVDFVVIELDKNGRGSATWDVPEWQLAVFNAPDAQEVVVPIGDSPEAALTP